MRRRPGRIRKSNRSAMCVAPSIVARRSSSRSSGWRPRRRLGGSARARASSRGRASRGSTYTAGAGRFARAGRPRRVVTRQSFEPVIASFDAPPLGFKHCHAISRRGCDSVTLPDLTVSTSRGDKGACNFTRGVVASVFLSSLHGFAKISAGGG